MGYFTKYRDPKMNLAKSKQSTGSLDKILKLFKIGLFFDNSKNQIRAILEFKNSIKWKKYSTYFGKFYTFYTQTESHKSYFKFTLSTFGYLYQNFHLKEEKNVDFYELNVQHDGNQNVLLNTPVSDLIDPKIRQASSLITMTHRDTSSDSLISKLKFMA